MSGRFRDLPRKETTMTTSASDLPIAIIGAGPIGLAAAAHLASRAEPFVVLEAGQSVGAHVSAWSHVQVFSPWRYNVDPVAGSLLRATGWKEPDLDVLPTGGELVAEYLRPLGALPQIAPFLRLGTRVVAVTRAGYDKMKTAGRDDAPFELRIHTSAGQASVLARAVIDASGTYAEPNPVGASGLPAIGEPECRDRVFYGIPDVVGLHRARYAGRRVLVVGSGHSAFNTLLDLADLVAGSPATTITWAVRRHEIGAMYGGGEADALPARGSLGARLRALVESGRVRLVTGFLTRALRRDGAQVSVLDASGRALGPFDEVVAVTGSRPDLAMLGELRLDLDSAVESPRTLASLIDPNVHSCGTVPPHGVEELRQPEVNFFVVGMKSYGRAPTFLMLTGYEQVRSVVAALAGDLESARRVELTLPGTGVCSSTPAVSAAASACCDTTAPETVAAAAHVTGCCTPSPEAEAAGACCAPAPGAAEGACCGPTTTVITSLAQSQTKETTMDRTESIKDVVKTNASASASTCCDITAPETVAAAAHVTGCCAPSPEAEAAGACCAPAPGAAEGACCGPTTTVITSLAHPQVKETTMDGTESIKDVVKAKYGAAALRVASGSTSCCGGTASCGTSDPITSNLYGQETADLPAEALAASLGCGNPTALAELRPGEVVLDLGSGGGIDVLLSARRVGPEGKAYGLDMTDEMLALARENQRKAGVANVEFLKGEIEHMPLPGAAVDVIISNCVINLSSDKDAVLAEAFRVLKPGGRLAVSDVVVRGEVPAAVRKSVELWIGCIAGALEESEYRAKLQKAGFEDVDLEATRVYSGDSARERLAAAGLDSQSIAAMDGKFISAFIRARKPGA
jgi:ubiquinone/menaquinone biosynthesis C-methylase UbiE/thioredoxin reductase